MGPQTSGWVSPCLFGAVSHECSRSTIVFINHTPSPMVWFVGWQGKVVNVGQFIGGDVAVDEDSRGDERCVRMIAHRGA